MLVLVLDTATPAITAAVADLGDGGIELRAQRVTVDGRAHGELLAPSIDAVLTEAGVKPFDLSAIVVGVGPGPFTGLRAGLVTAATMSSALGIPAYGVCTLDALGAATVGTVLVATDARRREIYWAVYRDGLPGTPPKVAKPAEVAIAIASEGVLRAVGEGAEKYAELLGVSAEAPSFPPPIEFARLAADRVRAKAPSEPLTPLYLRRPDAVEPATRKPALAAGER
ncbi:tRNA (adenosine(37)-N6)-threonylcarbamoyltransferase complex dimerization subunit type 1 TsaB [Rhizocola hellebori]|uniref:tRNA (Adenosine(37)-N6)-threonylcarbamoyltransferase complex dimerization subunit type 1 TsaB n=1 Tax=Rhizocola hellebori TaxID=1392758 RepID=A0A8J3Q6U5_9ACTN|nr:tRNA (adenosine(37)-N6)-threonylcarbamoyltransferase complex dimerization subunit type 1 TsaB [Rhizocola hellebori]GIH04357.1 tRNA (adenosine(37)-N6)-threonylcarbamoyltransferase complex dimerization subunit type 1 TsaB [Rhizocola hellebori]